MSQNQITPNTVISRSETLLFNNLGDDVVMMDIEQGSYYGLEEVAARIWELTENPVSVASICETLISEYDVPEQKCEQEVTAFIDDLINRKIIHITK